jgi:putative nucleotidyltransferase with HDIG domain
MNERALKYVIVVVLAGIGAAAALYLVDPSVPTAALPALVLLSCLALVAEALALLMPNTIYSSVAFIPFLTAVLIVPNWIALGGVLLVRLVAELSAKRRLATAVFNLAQHAITFATAVLVFRLAQGESMLTLERQSLSYVTLINGIPTLAAFITSFAINSLLVVGFVAARSARSFREVWRDTHLSTLGSDILASPIVFLFAWIYVNWGSFAATALWIPVLGLRQLQKTNLDLVRNNSELLELMVKSMEARDPYTSGHSRRVQQYSIAIARGLNLDSATIDQVSRAALLHDVGKIHEKYAPILRKPGKLSPEEWLTMQDHPKDGAELVSTMSKLHDIVPAIRHHHERWDGTGYPEGLAGETIPLVSRIIAFADTIDAMTSERPYRRTLSEEEVRAEIVRCRGAQFDPRMSDQILSAATWRLIFTPHAVEAKVAHLSILSRGRLVSNG